MRTILVCGVPIAMFLTPKIFDAGGVACLPKSLADLVNSDSPAHPHDSLAQMRESQSVTPSRGSNSGRGRSPRVKVASSPPIEEESLTAARPNATFTSCLSIPVQGATPIEPTSVASSSRMSRAQPQITAPTKRVARKSKLDALAAIHSHQDSSSPEPDVFQTQDAAYQTNALIATMTGLDMASVRTTSTRHPPASTQRPFGLQDCPSYYPSAEEFQDPMAYINSIAGEAAQSGICKIVPPEGWKMPFITDTEVRLVWLLRLSPSSLISSDLPIQDTVTAP